MAKVTGNAQGDRRIDGVLCVVEYVRTDTGAVFVRTTSRMGKGKWTLDGNCAQDAVAYKGNTWCTNRTVLEYCSKFRLPKV